MKNSNTLSSNHVIGLSLQSPRDSKKDEVELTSRLLEDKEPSTTDTTTTTYDEPLLASDDNSSDMDDLYGNVEISKDENYNIRVPRRFINFFTEGLISIPVILTDGKTYDALSIINWLSKKATSPLTNNAVKKSLTFNEDFYHELRRFCRMILESDKKQLQDGKHIESLRILNKVAEGITNEDKKDIIAMCKTNDIRLNGGVYLALPKPLPKPPISYSSLPQAPSSESNPPEEKVLIEAESPANNCNQGFQDRIKQVAFGACLGTEISLAAGFCAGCCEAGCSCSNMGIISSTAATACSPTEIFCVNWGYQGLVTAGLFAIPCAAVTVGALLLGVGSEVFSRITR